MKKILILLISLYSFSFSAGTVSINPFCGTDRWGRTVVENYRFTQNTFIANQDVEDFVPDTDWRFNTGGDTYIVNTNVNGNAYWYSRNSATDVYGTWGYNANTEYVVSKVYSNSSGKCQQYLDSLTPTCTEVEELIDNTCVPKCEGVNNYRLENGECSGCTDEYNANSAATCLCQAMGSTLPSQSVMSVFISLNDKSASETTYTCENDVSVRVYEYIDPTEGMPSDPCITRDGLRPPSGYVFKGEVQSDLECSQYVDIDNYVASDTSPVNSDCETDNNLYCYLKPSLSNQDDTGVSIDKNVTFDDGQYITEDIPSLDGDSMPESNTTSDSTKYTNTELTKINENLKKIINQGPPNVNVDNQINLEIVPTTLVDAIDKQTDVFKDLINDLNSSDRDYTELLKDEINATNQTNQLLKDDLNVTNSINDKLSMNTDDVPDDVDIEQLGNNVINDFNLIKSNFEDLKTTLESGFTFSTPSSSYTPPSANVYGGNLSLDLCSPFSNGFRPIITFMITCVGFILAIKIYIRGLF